MMARTITAILVSCTLAQAVIVDRIAIIAGKQIIKDSDLVNDLRLTAFFNQEQLTLTPTARKKAANRLLEQCFIREELEAGDFPVATTADTQDALDKLIKSRYRTELAYKQALASYGISEQDLKARLQWQLTVLRFIDLRFGSSIFVSDDDIRKYYDSHKQQYSDDLNASRSKIQDTLTGNRTTTAFYEWLDRQRQRNVARYLEDGLK